MKILYLSLLSGKFTGVSHLTGVYTFKIGLAYTSLISDGRKFIIIEIGMSHQIPIAIALC